jgi:hypothetical protein
VYITATIIDVIPGVGSRAWKRRAVLRSALLALTVAASLLATAGGAYAQTGDDGSAVDQYVEQPPSASGNTHSSGTPATPPTQSGSAGGGGTSALETIVTNPAYGGVVVDKKKKHGKNGASGGPTVGTPGRGESIPSAGAQGDVSASDALSSAVSAVDGGEAARLVGLLVVLFLISVATLTSAGIRQKRRAQ